MTPRSLTVSRHRLLEIQVYNENVYDAWCSCSVLVLVYNKCNVVSGAAMMLQRVPKTSFNYLKVYSKYWEGLHKMSSASAQVGIQSPIVVVIYIIQ